MNAEERVRRYASLAAAWSPQTIAKMLCDLEDTYAVVVNERDAARAEAARRLDSILDIEEYIAGIVRAALAATEPEVQ